MARSIRPSSAVAISKSGKPLYGTAAQLRIAHLAGGHDLHLQRLMAGAASEAVQQFWLKVVTHYTLTPYIEFQPSASDATSGLTMFGTDILSLHHPSASSYHAKN